MPEEMELIDGACASVTVEDAEALLEMFEHCGWSVFEKLLDSLKDGSVAITLGQRANTDPRSHDYYSGRWCLCAAMTEWPKEAKVVLDKLKEKEEEEEETDEAD